MAAITGNSFNPDKDIPDLGGKEYVVTGGSAGIGFGIAAHLLQHNAASITIVSNKEEHAMSALEEIAAYGDKSRVHWVKCNFEDLHETDRVAKELVSSRTRLDGLILNAGLGVGVYHESKDRLDTHFQVNHLSQFHLLLSLLPIIQSTPKARIVLESSDLHRGPNADTKFEDEAEINRDIGPAKLYNRTKLAQVLTTRALQRRIETGQLGFTASQQQIYVNAVHPGGVETDQPLQAEEAYGKLGKLGHNLVKPFMKDPVSQGCRPALYAATSPEIVEKSISGCYIVPDKKVTEPSKEAKDEQLGERLWALSERLLKDRLR